MVTSTGAYRQRTALRGATIMTWGMRPVRLRWGNHMIQHLQERLEHAGQGEAGTVAGVEVTCGRARFDWAPVAA